MSGGSLWRSDFAGKARQLVPVRVPRGSFSPDGKLIGGFFRSGDYPRPYRLAAANAETGEVVFSAEPPRGVTSRRVRWTRDGKNLAFINRHDGVDNLWLQPLTSSTPRQLTRFDTGRIHDFAWSHDGKGLYITRGSERGDVVLISNFR